jgi:hypothetical protein
MRRCELMGQLLCPQNKRSPKTISIKNRPCQHLSNHVWHLYANMANTVNIFDCLPGKLCRKTADLGKLLPCLFYLFWFVLVSHTDTCQFGFCVWWSGKKVLGVIMTLWSWNWPNSLHCLLCKSHFGRPQLCWCKAPDPVVSHPDPISQYRQYRRFLPY